MNNEEKLNTIYLLDVYKLGSNCITLRNVDKIVICCKRSIVRKLVYRTNINGKRIRKDSINKQRSVLLDGKCLYLFVDKYVDSGQIEHYFWMVNKAYNMTNVKCTIKGTNNPYRKNTLRRLLNMHCRYFAESDYSSDDGSMSS